MNDQVLSIEQMQELIELGIDTSKASMIWKYNPFKKKKKYKLYIVKDIEVDWEFEDEYPTFTLQDILEILPKRINISSNSEAILMFNNEGILEYYYVGYGEICASYHYVRPDTNLINSAFEMLKWCKQNNYI